MWFTLFCVSKNNHHRQGKTNLVVRYKHCLPASDASILKAGVPHFTELEMLHLLGPFSLSFVWRWNSCNRGLFKGALTRKKASTSWFLSHKPNLASQEVWAVLPPGKPGLTLSSLADSNRWKTAFFFCQLNSWQQTKSWLVAEKGKMPVWSSLKLYSFSNFPNEFSSKKENWSRPFHSTLAYAILLVWFSLLRFFLLKGS